MLLSLAKYISLNLYILIESTFQCPSSSPTMIGQLTNITNWYVLHRMKPQFLSRIASFIVFGDNGTEVLLVTKDDAVYSFGINKFGCLGLGHKNEVTEPTEILDLRSKQVVSLVNGAKHALALTENGEIFR